MVALSGPASTPPAPGREGTLSLTPSKVNCSWGTEIWVGKPKLITSSEIAGGHGAMDLTSNGRWEAGVAAYLDNNIGRCCTSRTG